MNNDARNIMPGDRVRVFNSRVYKDDKKTPISMTMQMATVVCRYGMRQVDHFSCAHELNFCFPSSWKYPDLVDVVFDGEVLVSHGHFTSGVEVVK